MYQGFNKFLILIPASIIVAQNVDQTNLPWFWSRSSREVLELAVHNGMNISRRWHNLYGPDDTMVPIPAIRQKLTEYGLQPGGPFGLTVEDFITASIDYNAKCNEDWGKGDPLCGRVNRDKISSKAIARTLESSLIGSKLSDKAVPWHKLTEVAQNSKDLYGSDEESYLLKAGLRKYALYDEDGRPFLSRKLLCEVVRVQNNCYGPYKQDKCGHDCDTDDYCKFKLRNVQKDWIDDDDILAMWEKTKYPIECALGGELTRRPDGTGATSIRLIGLDEEEAKNFPKCRPPRRMKRTQFGYRCVRPRGCMTIDGANIGAPCKFPFKFRGKTYRGCTTDADPDNRLWCSTKTNANNDHVSGQGEWGHCNSVCATDSD